jgi:hypothetical protein
MEKKTKLLTTQQAIIDINSIEPGVKFSFGEIYRTDTYHRSNTRNNVARYVHGKHYIIQVDDSREAVFIADTDGMFVFDGFEKSTQKSNRPSSSSNDILGP